MICRAQQDLWSLPAMRLALQHPKGALTAMLERLVAKVAARVVIDMLTKPTYRLRINATQKARSLWQDVKSIWQGQ